LVHLGTAKEAGMESPEKPGIDRRSFIKRAAATGGVTVFAAPAIQTVVAGVARASEVGASPPPLGCFHSTGLNGGCMPACTSTGATGNACNDICGDGQSTGACPVGSGGDNPCASDDYCKPECYEVGATKNDVTFIC
jgi:hypothetical protein